MPTGVDLREIYGRRAADAIAYLTGRGYDLDAWNWWDLAADAHARSFTVAKAARLDVLQAIRDALVASGNEREFVRNLTPELQRLGWWGRQVIVDSEGGAEVVRAGSPHRLRTIYRSNMSAAYNGARWRQQAANARSRPFWQYVAVMDAKTRPGHAALHGKVFRWDDPIWQYLYPPNDYNCRCRVRALTAADLERLGLKVESGADFLEHFEQEVGTDQRSGEVVTMPNVRWRGRDAAGRPVSMTPNPAWAANPGLVPWQPDLDRYDYDLARWFVATSLQGPAFARTWRRIEGAVSGARGTAGADELRRRLAPLAVRDETYAVAVLSPADRALLGVRTQTVRLSDDTLLKQAISRSGQDFGLEEYWRVQETIERAQLVVREGDRVLMFVQQGDEWYRAVVKRTEDGAELFLVSFHRTNPRQVSRYRRRGEVVRGGG